MGGRTLNNWNGNVPFSSSHKGTMQTTGTSKNLGRFMRKIFRKTYYKMIQLFSIYRCRCWRIRCYRLLLPKTDMKVKKLIDFIMRLVVVVGMAFFVKKSIFFKTLHEKLLKLFESLTCLCWKHLFLFVKRCCLRL